MHRSRDVIDFSSHILPDRVVKEVKDKAIRYSSQVSRHLQTIFASPHYRDTNIHRRIELLKKYGITYQVMSIGPTYIWLIDESDRDKRNKIVLNITKVVNNAISDIAEKFRDYFIGLATIPLLSDEAVDELKRAILELGLRGVQIYSNIYGDPIDLDIYAPFYREVNRLGIPVFIHPQNYEYYPWIYEYNLNQIFGWPFDTTLAMGRLVFSGITKQYPRIPFVTHHVGGMVPYYRGRIVGIYSREPHSFGSKIPIEDPINEFKKFYADTASFGVRETIEMGLEFFGEEKLVFGSDYPFGPEQGERYLRDTLLAINNMEISDEVKEKILWDNAARLLRIK
jgi:aminocarboxymuconate-semialdehyde decarboxylase